MVPIKPFLSMVTIQDVEHEDAMIQDDTRIPGELGFLFGYKPEGFQTPQGIGAGIIIDIGSAVDGILLPGCKIYYQQQYACKINDVWVVDARAIVAYEELGE